ncbi:MAG: DNRLRE domain-containing protein [Chloroflexi bacterium]|nr:DNRLRE domain-containing protein [Chloroflexota bacterium]
MSTHFLSTAKFVIQRSNILRVLIILTFILSLAGVQPEPPVQAADDTAVFAVISDFGRMDSTQAVVAAMVDSWNPDFIVTAGDNWQGSTMGTPGSTNSYENAVGNYYGAGGLTAGRVSRNYLDGDFYPVKGNHDYLAGANRFEQYFNTLPYVSHSGTASFYQFRRGPVHFFMLDSGPFPGGAPDVAAQQAWLQGELAASSAPWKIVVFHKPAYTGGIHGNATDMQWDFDGWGADFVIAGHVHIYERILHDGIRYFTAGVASGDARSGTKIGEAYYSGSGAMRVSATETSITFEYVPASGGTPVDTYTHTRSSPTDPTITLSQSQIEAFSSKPGVPSEERSYTVSGTNLTGSVTITPPAGFEISLSAGSGFVSTPLILTPDGGTLPSTTIYVRLNRETAGFSSGTITHTSPGAVTNGLLVYGTAAESAGWTAYNDVAWVSGQPDFNITTYTLPDSGTPTGRLVDYHTGTEVPATVTITTSGSPSVQTMSGYSGAESSSGTDAYNTFHGIADMAGVVSYGDSGWYVDLTFSGLSADQTYTFATTANRNDPAYEDRITRFIISGVDSAVNASTPGVTVKSNEEVAFSTGSNTEKGYVARWTGINPGIDGTFSVRIQSDTSDRRAYGPSVFMLQAEGEVVTHTLTVTGDGHGTVNLNPGGGIYLSGTTVTLVPVPDPGYAFSHWSGQDADDVITSGGVHTIVMDTDKAVTANFIVSDCSDVTLVATADTYLRSSQPTRNYGGSTSVQVSPLSMSPQNALFRWDLSSVPAGVTVSAASLTFHVTDSSNYPFFLYNMRRAWVEGTSNDQASSSSANWNTYDGSSTWGAGGAEDTTYDRYDTNLWKATTSTFGSTGSQTIELNASGVAVVQGWVDNPETNFGLTVQRDLENSSSNDYWIVASSEASNESQRPRLNLTYCQPSSDPRITTSTSALPAFTSQPGAPSTLQSYKVSAANLSAPLVISAPADFEISLSESGDFGDTISLTPSSGTIASTTIFVRFNRASEGSSNGMIIHASDGAATRTVAVSGTAAFTPPWTAYNDVSGTSSPANTTSFSLNTVDGMLLDFDTGASTGATVTVVTSSELYDLSSEGQMPDAGTDAYETFNGRADMTGVIMSATTNPVDFTMDLVFNGLDPSKTYTFATSVNRAGGTGGSPPYTERFTRYTIMDMVSATNASTEGVGVLNEHSVYFCTGENTTSGYVARWTNIRPNAQGSFTVRAQPHDPEAPRVYAFGMFMLQEEASAGQTVTVTVNPGQGKVYGESDPELTYTVVPSVPLTGKLARVPGEAVGSYAITQGSLSAGEGYNITFIPADFTITPRPVTVTADSQSKVYGDSDPDLTYQVTTGSLVGSDSLSGALARASGEDVGTYAIQQGTLTAGSNYLLTFEGAELTITPRPVTVTANNASKIYGDPDPELTYTYSPELAFEDKFSGELEREPGEDVGTYAITQGSLTLSSNYEITFVPGTFTIAKKSITITVDPGQSKVYGDEDPVFSYAVSDPSVSLTGLLAREPGENVGSYMITRGSLSAGEDYHINFVPASFTITPRPVTVTATNTSKLYGDPDPELTYTYSPALAFEDKFSGELEREPGEAVGTYAITRGNLALNDNYEMNFIPGTFTIVKKNITVTIDPGQSKVYGEDDPVFTYTVSDPSVSLTGRLGRVAGERVGTYAITRGSLTAGDGYNVVLVPAVFTITPRAASVRPDPASKIAGEPDPVLTGTLTGFLLQDGVTAFYVRTSGETVAGSPYTIRAILSPAEVLINYDITYYTAEFIIKAAEYRIMLPVIIR